MSTLVGKRYLNDFIRKQERHDVMAHDATTSPRKMDFHNGQ
jgi:hypothetical protein